MIKLFLLLSLALNIFASERIIALSPSVNEIIFALGEGDKIVGNTTHSLHPKEALNITKVGGYFEPSLEKIVALEPTLVIMQENNYKLGEKLKRLDIKSKIVRIDTLSNIRGSILEIGKTLEREDVAIKIVEEIDGELKKLKNITKDKRILIVMGHNTSLTSRIFVAGQNLYFDDIINESGNKNALQSQRKGQPVLNMENIISCNPDIVILLAHSMKEMGLSRDELINPWLELPINAGRTKSVYIIDKTYSGIPSDRLVYFLQDFREILNNYKSGN
ncbi:iron ABC transporter substrate-binding protein [Sulfurimonas crateris]|uniref:Iron ABC transporter substrate-binding protein n=1 Tax=Sulfurimonas crateris TaxID=2574727 RepID=A0A4U2Z9M0_9BACT|nr:helical backbone metal receptor [Sulfurimonas crateris]TKI70969.1 iron ABC transporter substrate-binding protein [Sulfurimonas crateris]